MPAASVVLILVTSALQLLGPLATAVAIDLFIRPAQARSATLASVSRLVQGVLATHGVDAARVQGQGLAITALVFVAALLATFVTLYAEGYVMQLMGQYIMNDLRDQ